MQSAEKIGERRAPEPKLPSDLHSEHQDLEHQVARLQQMACALTSVLPNERPKLFLRLVEGLQDYFVPHSEWEERVLYPLADAKFDVAGVQITAGLRLEHRIMERWIADLEKMLASSHPDPDDFSIKAQQLLGLIIAHFEVEEAVLIPLLEQ